MHMQVYLTCAPLSVHLPPFKHGFAIQAVIAPKVKKRITFFKHFTLISSLSVFFYQPENNEFTFQDYHKRQVFHMTVQAKNS